MTRTDLTFRIQDNTDGSFAIWASRGEGWRKIIVLDSGEDVITFCDERLAQNAAWHHVRDAE